MGLGPVLAIDADPNSNLGETLGIEVESSVGDIRENFMKDPQGLPSGMDKIVYLELQALLIGFCKPVFAGSPDGTAVSYLGSR